jgi:hypothetical protein
MLSFDSVQEVDNPSQSVAGIVLVAITMVNQEIVGKVGENVSAPRRARHDSLATTQETALATVTITLASSRCDDRRNVRQALQHGQKKALISSIRQAAGARGKKQWIETRGFKEIYIELFDSPGSL